MTVKEEIKKLKIKIKKLTKKKKIKKPRKPKQNIKNSQLSTTLPANIKPLSTPQTLVSGVIDKNDAKEIEKLQTLTNKIETKIKDNKEELNFIKKAGNDVLNEIKDEIEAVKRKSGRPKGSLNKSHIPQKLFETIIKSEKETNNDNVNVKKSGRPVGSKNKPRTPQPVFEGRTRSETRPNYDNNDDDSFDLTQDTPLKKQETPLKDPQSNLNNKGLTQSSGGSNFLMDLWSPNKTKSEFQTELPKEYQQPTVIRDISGHVKYVHFNN